MTGSDGVIPGAVLFDLDGTLSDSFGGIAWALNQVLAGHGLDEKELSWVHGHVGRGSAALVRDAVGPGMSAGDVEALAGEFVSIYGESFAAASPPLPGVRTVLDLVARGTGGRVAVVSNKFARFSRIWLRHWGLAELVAEVVGPETAGVRKPDPATVLPLLERFGVTPVAALLVGDMVVDVATGAAAGVPVVGVAGPTTGERELLAAGAVAVLAGVWELPGWLRDHGAGWGGTAADDCFRPGSREDFG